VILGNLATLDEAAGRLAEARVGYGSALAIARELGDRAFAGWLLGRLGRLDAREGRADRAAARFDEAEALLAAAGHAPGLAEVRELRSRS
jgi:hypothetical protein